MERCETKRLPCLCVLDDGSSILMSRAHDGLILARIFLSFGQPAENVIAIISTSAQTKNSTPAMSAKCADSVHVSSRGYSFRQTTDSVVFRR